MNTKICSKCNIEKNITEFNKHKGGKYGVHSVCKKCRIFLQKTKYKNKIKEYCEKNKEKIKLQAKKSREKNKEKNRIKKKQYYQKNKEKISLKGKLRYKECKQQITEANNSWREKNKDKVNSYLKSIKRKFIAYTSNCKYKKIVFALTFEEFENIVLQSCVYCDRESKIGKYNGIDRINPKRGYEQDNVVPCCAWCNKMKLNYSKEDFFKQIKKIYNKIIKGEV